MQNGFIKIKETKVVEIDATLVEYRHAKAGTRLLHINREDENKTFLIGFTTLPKDDTGVFHIIEHSVLCGSKKYPLRDPFVELLKSSLNTFLNAMTYPDKTVYPVSSTNDRDFLNLISVYMDAVLHPAFLENENIFMQEGHRLTLGDDGRLSVNGVVYNEMKGAYSSPEEIEGEEIMKMLYRGTPYQYSSGGDPAAIPTLTYEDFLLTHEKYYNPTDAYIVLDGSVDVDSVFELLDSYLREYDNLPSGVKVEDFDLTLGERRSVAYSVDDEEGERDKTRLTLALPGFRFDEKLKCGAMSVIKGALMGGQSAPFCKKILDSGLCEDVYATPIDGIYRTSTAITFVNVKDGKEKELETLAISTLREFAESGISKEDLTASLCSMEFFAREKNFGSTPPGIIYTTSVLESWLYSDDYTSPLTYEELFCELSERLATDYYDKLLMSIIPGEDEAVVLTLTPSGTLSRMTEEKNEKELRTVLSAMKDEEIRQLKEKQTKFDIWQETPDSEEDISKLPTLSISDIKEEPDIIPSEEYRVCGRQVISVPIQTHGITYASLYLDAADLDTHECQELAILSSLLTKLPTKKRGTGELRTLIKTNLGFMSASTVAGIDKEGEYTFSLKISAGMLNVKKAEFLSILDEVLNESVFDKREIRKIINQLIIAGKEALVADGVGIALDRVQSVFSEAALLNDYTGGYEFLKSLLKYETEDDIANLSERLESLLNKLTVKGRATVTVGGEYDEALSKNLLDILKESDTEPTRRKRELASITSEGISAPSRIGYAVSGIPYDRDAYTGDMLLVKTILNYEYLWGEIRAKGGAYGAGQVIRDGFMAFYSYRDPSPAASLAVYQGVSKFLRDFASAKDDSEIKRYIIGTFSTIDTVKSTRMKIDTEVARIFKGLSNEQRRERRLSALRADKNSLIRVADIIESASDKLVSSTVADKDTLLKMGELVHVIHNLT